MHFPYMKLINLSTDIRIGFSVSTLLVSEGEGLVTGRVSIGIENGVITEQEPAVSVVFNQASMHNTSAKFLQCGNSYIWLSY